MAERFTDDLVTEILVKLPVKSLARFRCVSIHFYKLIKSDEFIRMHLNCKKEESVVVIRNKIEKDDWTSVVSLHRDTNDFESLSGDGDDSFPDFDFSHYSFLGCDANGFVCITSRSEGFVTYLGNPALREFKRIPPTPFGTPLGFFPCEFGCGFGYDPNTKGYKIVRLLEFTSANFMSYYKDSTKASRVEIYCLKTDSWREIDNFVVPFLYGGPCFQLSFNGVGHWVQCGYGSDPDDYTSILCFNLSSEAFGYIKLPDEINPDEVIPGLLVLHESLAAHCSYRRPDEDLMVHIWVMKEYGIKESWVKQYTIGPLRICRPLVFLKDDRLLIESSNGRMTLCLLQTNEIKQLDVFGQPETFGAIAFTESLFSVASFFKNPN